MSEYFVEVKWFRGESEDYIDNKYSREHVWEFDGGEVIKASSSAHVVPPVSYTHLTLPTICSV